jgi:hypothetical protein
MEALLVLSGYLLFERYKEEKTPLLGGSTRRAAPVVSKKDTSGITNRNAEYSAAAAPPAALYRPSWLRQFEGTSNEPKAERELIHPSLQEEATKGSMDYIKARSVYTKAATHTLNASHNGVPVEEGERVRPPKLGGYEGYSEDRGRAPVPRFFRFNLGENLTTNDDNLRDNGLNKGFAFGQASRGQSQSNYQLRPDRDLQNTVSATGVRAQELAPTSTWHRGEYDREGLGRGPGGVQGKSYVLPDNDELDRRFRDDTVMSADRSRGASRKAPVPRTEKLSDPRVERHIAIPETDREKPFQTSRGAAKNPITRVNYVGKEADYLQQASIPGFDTLQPATGKSRRSAVPNKGATVTRDATKWAYTVTIKDARDLQYDPAADTRRVRQPVSKGTSLQYNLQDPRSRTVNSQLRHATNHETSALRVGGSERVPIHQLPVRVTFQQANTVVAPKNREAVATVGNVAGMAREGVSQHPLPPLASPNPSLTLDKKGGALGRDAGTAGRVSAGPSRAVEVLDREPTELFGNDRLADSAGILQLPMIPIAQQNPLDLGPGRQNLQAKTVPVGKRR